MRRPPDTLLTAPLVALTTSDLAYFAAGGALLGVTPFFVTGPLGAGPAAVGLAVRSTGSAGDRTPARSGAPTTPATVWRDDPPDGAGGGIRRRGATSGRP